jgi:hypothetical protein
MRIRLIALLAAILVTPALAQMSMQPMQRPGTTVSLPPAAVVQQDPDAATKVMTIEEAKAQIAKLRADNRDLTLKLSDSTAKLNETLATLTEWTQKTGSLVHAYCDGPTLSRSSAGASEECSTSGYACSPVEGTCRRSCNVTTDCAGYYVCDTAAHVCVHG